MAHFCQKRAFLEVSGSEGQRIPKASISLYIKLKQKDFFMIGLFKIMCHFQNFWAHYTCDNAWQPQYYMCWNL